MIIRSRWRRAGGLAAHLRRVDTNESVRMRDDLVRDAPIDIDLTLAMFTAIARTNARALREMIHIKVSPGRNLGDEEVVRLIAQIEREHVIPVTMPRFVVEHFKGDRARHFHIVYPTVDPATGRAVSSQDNYLRDETVSRLAELELGERVIPGPRQEGVVEELRRRGLEQEADALAAHAPTPLGNRLDDKTRQQTAALSVDANRLMSDAYAIWQKADNDWAAFRADCAGLGYIVARGSRAMLLVHGATGAFVPLARAIRQKAKEADRPVSLRERDLADAFPSARSFVDVREAGLDAEAKKAASAVDREFERLREEARRDGQLQLAERLRLVRERAKRERKARFKATLTERRAEIQAAYARRDRIRRARVNRAFLAARIMDRTELRSLVFNMAAASILLAGGGLGAALVAAGIALAVLPTRERARAASYEARLQREVDRDAVADDSRRAYDTIAADQPKPAKLEFAAIRKQHRVAAGALCHLILDEADGRLTDGQSKLKSALGRVLGDQTTMLEEAVLRGADRGVLAVLGWYDDRQPHHRQALTAALKQAGESVAGQSVANRNAKRHKVVRAPEAHGRRRVEVIEARRLSHEGDREAGFRHSRGNGDLRQRRLHHGSLPCTDPIP